MEYTGLASGWDQVAIRGDKASGEFIAFWLQGGRIQAGMNVNIWDQTETIGRLVGAQVDVDRLTDPSVELDSLLPVGSEAGRH
jgi:3-phenylpropionate/trans-cinnamate dioxygenase ferredoxin reductase subunit